MQLSKDFNPGLIRKKLVPIMIEPDISHLTDNQKKVISLCIECGKVLEKVFLLQKHRDNLKLLTEVEAGKDSNLIEYFHIMGGAFDQFADNAPYISGVTNFPTGGFYPEDLTTEMWNKLIEREDEPRDEFISPYTVISRKGNIYEPVPYAEYYREYLEKAAALLDEASTYADNYSLKAYLSAQSSAFLHNDFFEADIRWVQLADNDIEPLLGPHEFYEDRFLGYKAAFTAFIGVKNRSENSKLEVVQGTLDMLQGNLPVPQHYKKQKRGSISQIQIVNLVYCTGDGRGPIQTAAYNLPNSQKIRAEFGSKKVLLANIMEAKFNSIMTAITALVIDKSIQSKVTFPAYFNLILLHEISHELGIGFIKDNDGTQREVGYYLRDTYTVIEEAKADVMGVYSLNYLIKNGIIIDCTFMEVVTTYLVSILRSIRFGFKNSHGLANIIQWNFLFNEEVIVYVEKDDALSIDLHRFDRGIEELLTTLLTIQGVGDYGKAKELIEEYTVISPLLDKFIKRLEELPVDILPRYVIAGEKETNFK